MLAAEGYTNAEIASRMFISERTAKAHLSSAADKLNMGRVQMARLVRGPTCPHDCKMPFRYARGFIIVRT